MATHPIDPENGSDSGVEPPAQPNTTQLPVEPEFLDQWEPVDSEDPQPKPHQP